ncbi:hypothetical protein BJX96DRAFT_100358 [Aspergillus floccosus]
MLSHKRVGGLTCLLTVIFFPRVPPPTKITMSRWPSSSSSESARSRHTGALETSAQAQPTGKVEIRITAGKCFEHLLPRLLSNYKSSFVKDYASLIMGDYIMIPQNYVLPLTEGPGSSVTFLLRLNSSLGFVDSVILL